MAPTLTPRSATWNASFKSVTHTLLSLSLKKSLIFPKRFEFVGNDVCPDGNCPAQSKHDLLSTWPKPEIVHDVTKFIEFVQFYSIYLHHFKLRITPLRKLTTKFDYTKLVAPHWTDEAEKAFRDIQSAILQSAILANPCLMRFNHQRLVVLCTNFSSVGFGFWSVSQLRTQLPRRLWLHTAPARISSS
jgi:hypothetical protein